VRDEPFGYLPSGPHATTLSPSEDPAPPSDRGFRIHPVGRQDGERSASRGLRFAFVAAGAVSLAALALGGVSGVATDSAVEARGGPGAGSNVTPMRSPGTGGATAPDSQRRRSVGPLLGQRTLDRASVAPTVASAPLLPGVPAQGVPEASEIRALTAPLVAGAAAMSPLIRPLTATAPLAPPSWATGLQGTAPGLLARPVPTPSPTPSAPTDR
jgi:hypothetical protein